MNKASSKKVHAVRWSTVPFGKYQGRALPEILMRDLDWFFWVLPRLYGKLADEAEDLVRKARGIKIPQRGRKRLEAEYRFDTERRFCGFELVDANSPRSRWSSRLRYVDLRWPLCKSYDKRAGRIMIRDFQTHYFGERRRLTKERCEEFFGNDGNFIDV
jgi:hypothetical protein